MLKIFVLIIALLVVVLVLREPEVRRRLAALVLRRQGAARAVLGVVQPRDLQRQALALIKEKALLSIRVAHLPTDVTVLLNPGDLEGLGATRHDFTAELVEQIKALDGADAGGGIEFVLGARPQVKLGTDESLATGTVGVAVAWLEGTIAVTVLNEDGGRAGPEGSPPAGGLRLQIDEDGEPSREVVLTGQMTVGRNPESDIRIDHASVSRQHAILALEGPEALMISDLSSQNGVEIDDRGRLRPHSFAEVRAGQVVHLSKYVRLRLVSEKTDVAARAAGDDLGA